MRGYYVKTALLRATHSNFNQDEYEDLEKEVGQLSQKDFTEANDPVHLINSAVGNLSKSAFILFCKFAGDMALVGQSVDGFYLPVLIFSTQEEALWDFLRDSQSWADLRFSILWWELLSVSWRSLNGKKGVEGLKIKL